MRILLFVLLSLIGLTVSQKFGLHALHKFGKKHLKSKIHRAGLLAALRLVPKLILLPYDVSPIKQLVIVPQSNEFHSPTVRISRMMTGLDVKRLAREWPDSVTPGGPGPEWW
ncbi:uncharacterized protein LOC108865125 [Galendromus occidentalis]|uniref:Uncharacterized protein LOC108865125 n=1 Tax=Galendromus occidentalis TaxID=34638 RepID=A0AAJ7PAY7_9ACAR|nr:uncharacterized protein LOC108865125 [Galendromus occidentalis]